jgi:hypothetical protein
VEKPVIRLGKWSEESLDRLIRRVSGIPDPGPRIASISEEFLGLPYRGYTLVGDCDTTEALVIDLEGVDCFTFIDYVEAMRISNSYPEFRASLARVRYRGGIIAYGERNHFFSDWIESNSSLVHDVTGEVGQNALRRQVKTLNANEEGGFFLPGLKVKEREINYIPAPLIDDSIAGRLETGDYVGIYSMTAGLDVSHVGIFVRTGKNIFLRHASSSEQVRKVVDQEFRTYVAGKPGIVVLRPWTHPG